MTYFEKLYHYADRSEWYLRNFGFKRIIYSAGIPRSGSTLLYNILRIILKKHYGNELQYGWIHDAESMPKARINLIKTHEVNRIDYWRAHKTFFTYRDIRDVLVSRYRMFNKEPTLRTANYYIRSIELAKKRANLIIRYEDMMVDKFRCIPEISRVLNIDADPEFIFKNLPDPRNVKEVVDLHNPENLLHKNHITGTKKGEWREVLSKELQDLLHTEFGWWFEENGYEI